MVEATNLPHSARGRAASARPVPLQNDRSHAETLPQNPAGAGSGDRHRLQCAPEPVQAKEITARQGVPQRYLEQVMQQLVRAGVLKGVRGPRGGYRLARERRRISVGDVVRVAESIDDDEKESAEPRSELGARIVTPLITSLQEEVMARLDAISIEDLCQRARAAGVDCGGRVSADFTI